QVTGTTTMDATATAELSSFNLDFAGMTVDRVTVVGAAATWDRNDAELVVKPATPLTAGTAFEVVVSYHGVPGEGTAPTWGIPLGWIRTPGGSYTFNEPDAAHTWFPSNDHPSDKATFTFHITVPTGPVAVANGTPSPPVESGGRTTWTWTMAQPMATYLAVVAIGDYAFRDSTGPNGLVMQDAYLRSDAATVQPCLDVSAQAIA